MKRKNTWYGYRYIKEVKSVKYDYIEHLKFWNILRKRSGSAWICLITAWLLCFQLFNWDIHAQYNIFFSGQT